MLSSAPVPARIDPSTLTAVVASLLDERKVAHGPIRSVNSSLNWTYTDLRHVFVKVNRPGELTERPRAELVGALHAATLGVRAPVPLVSGVIDFVHTGEMYGATVWKHVFQASPPALIDQAILLARAGSQLAKANTLPPTPVTMFNPNLFVDRIERRLVGRSESAAIAACAKEAVAVIDRRPVSESRWIHGDLHLRNAVWGINGQPTLVDWESNTCGPIEWDAAALVRSCFVHGSDRDWDTRRAAAQAAIRVFESEFPDLDLELLDALVRLRNASAQSHLMVWEQDEQCLRASRNLDAVLNSASGGKALNAA